MPKRESGKLATLKIDWRNGRRYGYPFCCVAWYCLGPLLGARRQATRRGVVTDERNRSLYVPCRYHMRRHPRWRWVKQSRRLADA